MLTLYEPVRDNEPDARRNPTFLHGPETRCPLLSDGYQWEVGAGTCCLFDAGDLVKLLRLEAPDLVGLAERGPTTIEAPAFLRRLRFLSTAYQDAGDDALVELEIVEVAADWIEKVMAAGFGVLGSRVGESLAEAVEVVQRFGFDRAWQRGGKCQ